MANFYILSFSSLVKKFYFNNNNNNNNINNINNIRIWNPNGWLSKLGVLDFAGGLVIHTSAGVSGLIFAYKMEKRKNFDILQDFTHKLI